MAEGKYLREITSDDLQYLQNITDDVSSDNDEFFDFDIEDPGSPPAAPAVEELDKSLQPANQSMSSVYFETVEPTSPAMHPALSVPSSGAESPRSSTAEPRSPREPSTTESKTASSPSRAEDAKLPLVHPPPPLGNPSFK